MCKLMGYESINLIEFILDPIGYMAGQIKAQFQAGQIVNYI